MADRVELLSKLVCTLVMGCCLGLVAQPAQAEQRLAFVAGIDSYPNLPREMQLERAVADAEAVGDTLQQLGFTVTRLSRGVTQEVFLRRFAEFTGKIEPGDTAVFFFAGHGIGLDGTNYLIPADVPKLGGGDERLVKSRSMAETDLISDIRDRGARVTVMVIDACRNNPFPRTGTRSLGLSRGLNVKEPAEGVFSIYSAGLGQEALDRLSDQDRTRNSVFTGVFMVALRKPGLNLVDLGETVRDEVAALAKSVHHQQVPAVYNQILGARTVFLAGPPKLEEPKAAVVPPPVTDPCSAAADHWRSTEALGTKAAFEDHVARFSSCAFSSLAKAKIEALKKQAALPRPNPEPPPRRTIAGVWSGNVRQPDNNSYTARMQIEQSGNGSIDYPTLKCGGTLMQIGKTDDEFTYQETLTYGNSNCVAGTIVVVLSGNALRWEWRQFGLTLASGMLAAVSER